RGRTDDPAAPPRGRLPVRGRRGGSLRGGRTARVRDAALGRDPRRPRDHGRGPPPARRHLPRRVAPRALRSFPAESRISPGEESCSRRERVRACPLLLPPLPRPAPLSSVPPPLQR